MLTWPHSRIAWNKLIKEGPQQMPDWLLLQTEGQYYQLNVLKQQSEVRDGEGRRCLNYGEWSLVGEAQRVTAAKN